MAVLSPIARDSQYLSGRCGPVVPSAAGGLYPVAGQGDDAVAEVSLHTSCAVSPCIVVPRARPLLVALVKRGSLCNAPLHGGFMQALPLATRPA